MSSYFIALINIEDQERYEQYLAGYGEVFEQYKGQVIAVEDSPRVLEGAWPAVRTVLIKFPGDQELLRWYQSPAYQQLAQHRWAASEAQIAIVSGRD